MKLLIELNGTNINPYHKLGLSQNPFPQIPKYEYVQSCLIIQELGGDPILDTNYIRQKLKGFSKEFIELCVNKFEKGKYVTFYVEFSL